MTLPVSQFPKNMPALQEYVLEQAKHWPERTLAAIVHSQFLCPGETSDVGNRENVQFVNIFGQHITGVFDPMRPISQFIPDGFLEEAPLPPELSSTPKVAALVLSYLTPLENRVADRFPFNTRAQTVAAACSDDLSLTAWLTRNMPKEARAECLREFAKTWIESHPSADFKNGSLPQYVRRAGPDFKETFDEWGRSVFNFTVASYELTPELVERFPHSITKLETTPRSIDRQCFAYLKKSPCHSLEITELLNTDHDRMIVSMLNQCPNIHHLKVTPHLHDSGYGDFSSLTHLNSLSFGAGTFEDLSFPQNHLERIEIEIASSENEISIWENQWKPKLVSLRAENLVIKASLDLVDHIDLDDLQKKNPETRNIQFVQSFNNRHFPPNSYPAPCELPEISKTVLERIQSYFEKGNPDYETLFDALLMHKMSYLKEPRQLMRYRLLGHVDTSLRPTCDLVPLETVVENPLEKILLPDLVPIVLSYLVPPLDRPTEGFLDSSLIYFLMSTLSPGKRASYQTHIARHCFESLSSINLSIQPLELFKRCGANYKEETDPTTGRSNHEFTYTAKSSQDRPVIEEIAKRFPNSLIGISFPGNSTWISEYLPRFPHLTRLDITRGFVFPSLFSELKNINSLQHLSLVDVPINAAMVGEIESLQLRRVQFTRCPHFSADLSHEWVTIFTQRNPNTLIEYTEYQNPA